MAGPSSMRRSRYRLVAPQEIFDLHPGRNLVGRYSYCEVHVPGEGLLGEEGVIDWHEDGLEITPFPGAHLRVDDREVKETVDLQEGAVLWVGEVPLRVVRKEATVTISRVRRAVHRKGWMLWAGGGLVLAAVVGMVGAAAGMFLTPDRVKAFVCEEMSAFLKRSVEAGSAGVDLWRGEITLSGVVVRDKAAFSLRPFAEVGRLDIEVSPFRFLLGGEWLRRVDLQDVEVVLRKDPEGNFNVADLLRRLSGVDWRSDIRLSRGKVVFDWCDGAFVEIPSGTWRRSPDLGKVFLAAEVEGSDGTLGALSGEFRPGKGGFKGKMGLDVKGERCVLPWRLMGLALPPVGLDLRMDVSAPDTLLLPGVKWSGRVSVDEEALAVRGEAALDLLHGISTLSGGVEGERLKGEWALSCDWENGFFSGKVDASAGASLLRRGAVGKVRVRGKVWSTSAEVLNWEGGFSWRAPDGEDVVALDSAGGWRWREKVLRLERFGLSGRVAVRLEAPGEVHWAPLSGRLSMRLGKMDLAALGGALGLSGALPALPYGGELRVEGRQAVLSLGTAGGAKIDWDGNGHVSVEGTLEQVEFSAERLTGGEWRVEGKGGMPLRRLLDALTLLPGVDGGLPDGVQAEGMVRVDFFRLGWGKAGWEAVLKGSSDRLSVRLGGGRRTVFDRVGALSLNVRGVAGGRAMEVRKLQVEGGGIDMDLSFNLRKERGGERLEGLSGTVSIGFPRRDGGWFADWTKRLAPFPFQRGRLRLEFGRKRNTVVTGALEDGDTVLSFEERLVGGGWSDCSPGFVRMKGSFPAVVLQERLFPWVGGGWIDVKGAVAGWAEWGKEHRKAELSFDRSTVKVGGWFVKDADVGMGVSVVPSGEGRERMEVVFRGKETDGLKVLFEAEQGGDDVVFRNCVIKGDVSLVPKLFPGLSQMVRFGGEVYVRMNGALRWNRARRSMEVEPGTGVEASSEGVRIEVAVPGEGWLPMAFKGKLILRNGKVSSEGLTLLPEQSAGREVAVNVTGDAKRGIFLYAAGGRRGFIQFLGWLVKSLGNAGVRLRGVVRVGRGDEHGPGKGYVKGEVEVAGSGGGRGETRFTGEVFGEKVKGFPVSRTGMGPAVVLEGEFGRWPGALKLLPRCRARVTVPLEPAEETAAVTVKGVCGGRRLLPSGAVLEYPEAALPVPVVVEMRRDVTRVSGRLPLRKGEMELLPLGVAAVAVLVYEKGVPQRLEALQTPTGR